MVTHLKRTLIRNMIGFACFALALIVAPLFIDQTMTFEPHDEEAGAATAAPTPSRIDRLFESGECWTGEAPADVEFPGHVVLRKTDADQPAYLGPKWVGRALEQIFEGKDHGIYQINGFCR